MVTFNSIFSIGHTSRGIELKAEGVFHFTGLEGLRLGKPLGEVLHLLRGERAEVTIVCTPRQEKGAGDDVVPQPAVSLQPVEFALLIADQADIIQTD